MKPFVRAKLEYQAEKVVSNWKSEYTTSSYGVVISYGSSVRVFLSVIIQSNVFIFLCKVSLLCTYQIP